MTTNPDPDPYSDPQQPLHVLTLWQPWASAMAWGEKTVETRPRFWRCLKWVAIHAGLRWPSVDAASPLLPHFMEAMKARGLEAKDLPRSAIVAVVRVFVRVPADAAQVSEKERAWGDYSPGRWAYFTADLGVLPKPIAWTGAQGLQVAPWELRKQIAEALRK